MTTDSFCYALNRTARHYRYHRHMRALAADECIHGHCLSFHGTYLTTNLIMDAIANWHLFLSLYRSNCTRNFLYVLDLTLSVWLARLFSLRSFGTVLAEVGVNITFIFLTVIRVPRFSWDVVSASRRGALLPQWRHHPTSGINILVRVLKARPSDLRQRILSLHRCGEKEASFPTVKLTLISDGPISPQNCSAIQTSPTFLCCDNE